MRKAALLAAFLASPAFAQDGSTLADIRQELSVVYVEVERLRSQLSTSGSPQVNTSGSSVLARIDAIERELRRLTGQTEQLEIRLDAIVVDGTNRIGDLEFRVCELEPACDIATYEYGGTLGGDALPEPVPVAPPQAGIEGLAVSEQSDFDAAREAFEAGDFGAAAAGFTQFLNAYPNGPLSAEAQYLKGEALAQQEDWREAARSYLDAFSIDPNGPRAPEALLRLGVSLGELGQKQEACLTLSEVGIRFPSAVATASVAANEQQLLGCP